MYVIQHTPTDLEASAYYTLSKHNLGCNDLYDEVTVSIGHISEFSSEELEGFGISERYINFVAKS